MKRKQTKSVTTEQLAKQVADDIATWTPDQKAHARAKINRAFVPNSASRTAELRQQIVCYVGKLTGMTPEMCADKSADMLLNLAAMTTAHQNYLGAMRADALIWLAELENLVAGMKQLN
jgi:hypothetical protein